MMTGFKGVSSMKLHRDLTTTQKTTWFLAHRIRAGLFDKGSWLASEKKFTGPVEVEYTTENGEPICIIRAASVERGL